MITSNGITEIQNKAAELRKAGKTIGLVPTMGALHQGHLSLIEHAKKESDVVVVSIFVNPFQFGPKEDFNQYPRNIQGDTEICGSAGADILFTPSASDIYPQGYGTYVSVENLSNVLCGITRPGHFRGVATVVLKLFNIIKPHKSFFGQKDYQQTVIIKRMAEDLNVEAEIVVLPTIRESDGLAMSSRNRYLSKTERQSAAVIYRSLKAGISLFEQGERNSGRLRDAVTGIIHEEPSIKTEYVAVIHPETLEEATEVRKGTVIAIAVRVGNTRLIDNIIL